MAKGIIAGAAVIQTGRSEAICQVHLHTQTGNVKETGTDRSQKPHPLFSASRKELQLAQRLPLMKTQGLQCGCAVGIGDP